MEGRRLRASGRSPAPPSGHPASTLQPRPSPSSPSPLMRASSHLARTPRCLHTCRSSHTSARQVLSHVMRAINEAQVVPEAHPRPKANPADSHSAGHTAQPTPASRPLALPSLSRRRQPPPLRPGAQAAAPTLLATLPSSLASQAMLLKPSMVLPGLDASPGQSEPRSVWIRDSGPTLLRPRRPARRVCARERRHSHRKGQLAVPPAVLLLLLLLLLLLILR